MASLVELRDAYRGQTVVFIGAGTSIRPYDLSRIRHPMISCNYFLPFGPERWGVTLEAYLCHDPRVFFVPWERHRAGKRLASPDGDLSAFPSPADYIMERQLYRKTKLILPATLDWYTGLDTHWLFHGDDTDRYRRWLPTLLASGAADQVFTYGVVEPPPRLSAGGLRRSLRRRVLYGGTYKEGGFDPRAYTYAVPRWIDALLPPVRGAALLAERGDGVSVPMWAVNSFCNTILPVLYFLGFAEIILIGVDYDKEGYFFNPYRSPLDRFFYKEEFDELYFLFDLGRRLPHRPRVRIVRTGTNHIRPPDGFVSFEEICA
jgi:hypothetical protein